MSAAAEPTGERVERGRLGAFGYAELLRRLQAEGFTGTLLLRRPPLAKATCFQEGRLIFARSSDANDRLGEFLLRSGAIHVSQYLESAARLGQGRRQGAILCEMGAISADDLVYHVKEQVSEILYSQLDWVDGEYEISPGEGSLGERIVLNLSIEDVILRGSRRLKDWALVWRGIGASLDTLFTTTDQAASLRSRATLNQDEAHVLSLVNGRLSVGRILDLGYGSQFDSCRALWALRMTGAIEPRLPSQSEGAWGEDYALADLVETYDRVYSRIHVFVAERIGELVEHFFSRTLEGTRQRYPVLLAGVQVRNQGRIEYEDLFSNLLGEAPEKRLVRGEEALAHLLNGLLESAGRELGAEEQRELGEQLRELLREMDGTGASAGIRRVLGGGYPGT